jgi:hypothetical protein
MPDDPRYSDLSAVYINCALKRSPESSHTQGLGDRSIAIMEENGVVVETVRAIDHYIATGVWPDMTSKWPSYPRHPRARRPFPWMPSAWVPPGVVGEPTCALG